MSTINDRRRIDNPPVSREEREKLALEKVADLFVQLYGPAIKELETK